LGRGRVRGVSGALFHIPAMPVTCRSRGAVGSHLTHKCPKYSPLVSEIDPAWARVRDLTDHQYITWLEGPHDLIIRELQNLKRAADRIKGDIELDGAVKELMLAGWRHGPYEHDSIVSQRPEWRAWKLKVEMQGIGRVCFDWSSCGIRFEDTQGCMRLLNANNFFTTKTLQERQLKHVTAAVRDSREWKNRDRACNTTADDIAKRVLQVFPQVEYRRVGDVKIFIKRNTKLAKDETVYCFVADELRSRALAKEAASSAEDPSVLRQARAKFERMSMERDLCKRLPPVIVPETWESLADEEAAPEFGLCVAALRLSSSRNPEATRQALLTSEVAAEASAVGLDIEPAWAKGAKIFVPISEEDVPADLELRPYHVLVSEEHVPRIKAALATLPCKQRPLIKSSQEFTLEQEPPVTEGVASAAYTVERTFICMPEPLVFTPRSDYTRSHGDAFQGHKNPRSKMRAPDSCADVASSCNSARQIERSTSDHWVYLTKCYRRRDLDGALQCFSDMFRENVIPDDKVFTILIDLCGKVGAAEEAERLMVDMCGRGVLPSCDTFNCLINVYAKVGNASKSEDWFHHMKKANVEPTLATYNCMIRSSQHCLEQAEAWFEEARARFPSFEVATYTAIMEISANKGLPQKAEQFFRELQRMEFPCSREAYRAVIRAHATGGHLSDVMDWVDKAETAGFVPSVYEYTQMLRACAPNANQPAANSLQARFIFLGQLAKGIAPNHENLQALDDALGKWNARSLCSEVHLHTRAAHLDWWQDPRNLAKPSRLARELLEKES